MSAILSLISGSLFRDPERKVSRNDKSYVSATLKVGDKNDSFFVRLFVFGETAQQEMEGLRAGDAVSVVGGLTVELYEGKPSYSMAVNRALALKKEKKEPKPKAEKSAPPPRQTERAAAPFDDSIPF